MPFTPTDDDWNNTFDTINASLPHLRKSKDIPASQYYLITGRLEVLMELYSEGNRNIDIFIKFRQLASTVKKFIP